MAGRVKPIPVPVILAAVNGDEDALAAVVAHYQSYIRALATRPLKDDYPRMINRRATATVLSIRKKSSKSMRWTEGTRISSSILMMASQGRRLTGPVSRA